MATGDEKRLLRNSQRRIAYASMDDEKKDEFLAKRREYQRHRSQSVGPSSGKQRSQQNAKRRDSYASVDPVKKTDALGVRRNKRAQQRSCMDLSSSGLVNTTNMISDRQISNDDNLRDKS